MTYTAKPPILSTVYDVIRLRFAARQMHRKRQYCAVHCRSYITSLVGEHLKLKFGLPFVFDMRAFYADERVDGGLWNLKNPLFKAVFNFFKKKERDFLRHADHVVTLTEKARDIIYTWKIGRQNIPIEVIPCCADLGHFDYLKIEKTRTSAAKAALGIDLNEKTLVYLGSVGTWYMLPEMLRFFKFLLESQPEFRFLILTHDTAQPIVSHATQLGIDPAKLIVKPASREELPTLLSIADAALFFIVPKFSKAGSSPTKHGELLGMGIPIICNGGVGDMDRIVAETQSGLLIENFSDDSLRAAANKMPLVMAISKEKLRAAAFQFYSLDEGVMRYNRIYRQLCQVQ